MGSRIAIFSNTAWNIHTFRRSLVLALMAAGHEVVALAPHDSYADQLPCAYYRVPMSGASTNPVAEGLVLIRTLRALSALRPQVLLNYTIKPNIYGTFAARLLGIPTINNISGLGTAFLHNSAASRFARGLYRFSQVYADLVFFQNEDDRRLFLSAGRLPVERTARIPGSGIDTDKFSPRERHGRAGAFSFLLIARLLADKGIREFVEAARLLRSEGIDAEFWLLGQLAPDNRTAIARSELDKWVAAGVVQYLGEIDDVRDVIAEADCVVLPSYREGLPRTLLEAGSMAKPLVASDVPGCREVVIDRKTGLLCRVRDHASLADAMRRIRGMQDVALQRMGAAARARVVAEFGEGKVIASYMEAVDRLLEGRNPRVARRPIL